MVDRCDCGEKLTTENRYFAGHAYNICKKCFNEKKRKKYASDTRFRKRILNNCLKQTRKMSQRHAGFLEKTKTECSVCKKALHRSQLDFDHISQSIKVDIISRMHRCSASTLLSEISKCRVICANCHRDRTQEQLKLVSAEESRKHGASHKQTGRMFLPSYVEPVPPEGTSFKICTKCGENKPETSFGKTHGRLRSECNWCKALSARQWRENNRVKRSADRKRRLVELNEFINNMKDDKPCADCNLPHSYWRLDFDHRNGEKKLFEISKLKAGLYSKKKILEEIAKCDLVCANCHRLRTWNRSH
jgi:hypothetical protein